MVHPGEGSAVRSQTPRCPWTPAALDRAQVPAQALLPQPLVHGLLVLGCLAMPRPHQLLTDPPHWCTSLPCSQSSMAVFLCLNTTLCLPLNPSKSKPLHLSVSLSPEVNPPTLFRHHSLQPLSLKAQTKGSESLTHGSCPLPLLHNRAWLPVGVAPESVHIAKAPAVPNYGGLLWRVVGGTISLIPGAEARPCMTTAP